MESVFRKGLVRNYVDYRELTRMPHGRIDIANSVKKGIVRTGQLFCDYELYDCNTIHNRVIRSVVTSMLNSGSIHSKIRSKMKVIEDLMRSIPEVHLNTVNWNLLEYRGCDRDYRMALRICRLYVDCLLPSYGESQVVRGFLNDSQEHKLFEDFVRGYFEIEHPDIFRNQRQLDWAVTGCCSDYLPGMEMDILLKKDNKVLIIDTKCYGTILSGKNGFKGLNSSNLYQMNAYIQNWQYAHPKDDVSGLLLYAKTEENFESCDNHVLGHMISVRTLDCSKDWISIASCLDDISKQLQCSLVF